MKDGTIAKYGIKKLSEKNIDKKFILLAFAGIIPGNDDYLVEVYLNPSIANTKFYLSLPKV